MNLHVEHYGNAGPELVLVHGWGLSSAIWAPLVERLSQQYRLTLIDIPGLGQSPAIDSCSVETVARALLEAAPDNAVWVGWSLGGELALKAARLDPTRVKALMLVAATPCFIQREGWPSAMDPEVFDAFAEGVVQNPAKTLSRFAMLQTQGSQTARDELRTLKQVIAQAEPCALADTLALLREDLRPDLASLSVPATCLLGLQDQLVPASLAEAITRLNPSIRVQLGELSAHLPFLTERDRFEAELARLVHQSSGAA